MRPYTAVQLFEVAVFCGVLLYGILAHRPSVTALGGGLLAGKAILNILAPEGGSVVRRSIIGYTLGGLFVALAIAAIYRAG